MYDDEDEDDDDYDDDDDEEEEEEEYKDNYNYNYNDNNNNHSLKATFPIPPAKQFTTITRSGSTRTARTPPGNPPCVFDLTASEG